jgi:nucleotide-binding universal stress UspA family protein
MKPIRHVMVATDFSEASTAAMDAAASLVSVYGARVTVIHVFDETPLLPPVALPNPQRIAAEFQGEMKEAVLAELAKVRATALPTDTSVETVAVSGPSPAKTICQEAMARDVDLIVVSTHGRTGLSHMLIGSVAEKVVRHAPCPVLAVR